MSIWSTVYSKKNIDLLPAKCMAGPECGFWLITGASNKSSSYVEITTSYNKMVSDWTC